MLKTLLVMVSLVRWQGGAELQMLGQPRDVGHWCCDSGQWAWEPETQKSPETSSTGSNWGVDVTVDDTEKQKSRETSSTGSTWCFIFPVEQVHRDWLGDLEGQQSRLDKSQVKRLLEGVQAQCSEIIKDRSEVGRRGSAHRAVCTEAMDLSSAWDFSMSEHRREALRLVNQHRPALLMLGSNGGRRHSNQQASRHFEFVVQLAKLQNDAGRGFIMEPPVEFARRDDHPALQALRQRPEVLSLEVNVGSRPSTSVKPRTQQAVVLLTNVAELGHRFVKQASKCLLSQSHSLKDEELCMFQQVLFQGLRKHLQCHHFRVFGCPDHWQWHPGELRCMHFQPRQTLCVPRECRKFDTSRVSFTGKRVTVQNFVAGGSRIVEDDWTVVGAINSHQPWSGHTSFAINTEIILPNEWKVAAASLAKSAAHDLYVFQRDEAQFQFEWIMTAFPSHRILEERASRRASTAASSSDAPSVDEFEDFDFDEFIANAETAGNEPERTLVMNAKEKQEQPQEDEIKAARELRDLNIDEQGQDLSEEPEVAPDLRRELYRLHRNLGHPDIKSFVRALRHAGVRSDIIRWTKRSFSCPICESRRKPKAQRPGHLTRQMGFNEVIGMDLFFIRRQPWLNIICWGTLYQWVEKIPDKSAETVAKAFFKSWCAHYGAPQMLIVDQGGEFTGRWFVDIVSDAGILLHYADVNSPWQNSRTERAGGIFKEKLEAVCQEASVVTEEELQMAASETLWTRNQYLDRSGFSPHQRVFGSSLRPPMHLLSDDVIARELLQNPHTDAMQRTLQIREVACREWMKTQDREAVNRATKANTRTSDINPVKTGDLVYLWRDTADFVGWSGPGKVIAESENGRSLWISLRGYLIKASREQVRNASREERMGAEIMQIISPEMVSQLESGKLRNFTDIEGEGEPPASSAQTEANIVPEDSRMEVIPEEPDEVMAENDHGGHNHNEIEETQSVEPSTRAPSRASEGEAQIAGSIGSTPMPSRRTSIQVDEASGGLMPFGPVRDGNNSEARPMPYPFSAAPPSWPTPETRSTFLEIAKDSQKSEDGCKYWKNKARDQWEPVAASKDTFFAHQGEVSYSHYDRRFYLAKKKESPGQVQFNRLPSSEQAKFQKSRIRRCNRCWKVALSPSCRFKRARNFVASIPST